MGLAHARYAPAQYQGPVLAPAVMGLHSRQMQVPRIRLHDEAGQRCCCLAVARVTCTAASEMLDHPRLKRSGNAAAVQQGGGVHSAECAVEPQPRHRHADHRQAAQQQHAQEPGSRAEGQSGQPVHGGPGGQRAPEEEPLDRWDLHPDRTRSSPGHHLIQLSMGYHGFEFRALGLSTG